MASEGRVNAAIDQPAQGGDQVAALEAEPPADPREELCIALRKNQPLVGEMIVPRPSAAFRRRRWRVQKSLPSGPRVGRKSFNVPSAGILPLLCGFPGSAEIWPFG